MTWLRLRPLAALLLVLALWGAPAAQAQVRDDSTKVLYGPKTTRIIYEAEVLRDSTSGTPLDTTLTRWPQARFWFHDTTFQQDLGAVGTASRPLLYQPNYQLGARFGRNVFDKYARDAATVPYYDSRSPYSFFRYIQSGAGEQVFEISYSRSLKKNFSIGVAYERIASNKVLDPVRSRDGLVEHSNILLFGRYQTDDERYHLLVNFTNVRHRAVEQGGIRPVTTTVTNTDGTFTIEGENRPQELFKYAQQKVNLSQAVNTEDRDELYFTQTYRLLGRGFTAYHTFDAKRQYNSYYDAALTLLNNFYQPDVFYYPRALRNTAAILDRAEYRQVENTVGLLGRTDAVEYRVYSRFRNANLIEQSLKVNQLLYQAPTATGLALEQVSDKNYFNTFVGGTAAFNYRKIYAIEAAGEYKVGNEYWLQGSIRTGPLSAEALVNSYSPTLMQQKHIGNNYQWDNDFKNTSTQQLTGRLRLKLPDIGILNSQRFEASASVANIVNLVYYGTDGRPTQLSDTRNLLIIYARHIARLGRVGIDNQATYTRGGESNKDGIRIPGLVSNSRVYYESYVFRKALFTQVGAEMYFQSRFQAYNYSPSTQQFYQQDHFSIRPYPIVDVFLSADIKTVSVFLKMAYLNQGVFDNGYFTTPYYTGYPRRFQFGVKWNFFN